MDFFLHAYINVVFGKFLCRQGGVEIQVICHFSTYTVSTCDFDSGTDDHHQQMLFPTTQISNTGRLDTGVVAFRHGVALIGSAGGSGVMDGGDCTRPAVVGWVDARLCVPVRDVSRSTETGAPLAVEVCGLTATPLQCSLC